jgi:hypothetical protein
MPLCSAESGIQEGVINETISLQTALELQSFPKEDVVALADMLNSIKLSVNNQREVLGLLKEIAARDSISILQILNEAPVGPILADPDMDRNRKTQRLRSVLREKRFSRLSEIEHRFDQWVRRLKLPPGIDLIAPKHFEATHFILQIRFKNSKELQDHLEFSQKLPETHLEHILKF